MEGSPRERTLYREVFDRQTVVPRRDSQKRGYPSYSGSNDRIGIEGSPRERTLYFEYLILQGSIRICFIIFHEEKSKLIMCPSALGLRWGQEPIRIPNILPIQTGLGTCLGVYGRANRHSAFRVPPPHTHTHTHKRTRTLVSGD